MKDKLLKHSFRISLLCLICFLSVTSESKPLSQINSQQKNPDNLTITSSADNNILIQKEKEKNLDIVLSKLVKVEEELASIKQNIKEQEFKVKDAEARTSINFASLIVMWSGFILTAFTIVIGIASFFGFRELKRIRTQYEVATKLKSQFDDHLKSVKKVEKTIEEQLKGLTLKFENESQILIEASYNYSEGSVAYKRGDNIKAIEYFSRVLKLQPFNAKVYCRIGRSYTNLGETEKAIDHFNKAISIEPNNAEAFWGLATSYRYMDIDKAIFHAQKATATDPSNFEAFDYLGLLFRDKEKINESIIAHEKAKNIKQRPETNFFLSLLYAYQKDFDRAKLMIITANLELREEQDRDRIRPLWATLIKWAKLILEDNYTEAFIFAKELAIQSTTPRMAQAVLEHITFLLKSVEKAEYITSYTKLFKLKKEE